MSGGETTFGAVFKAVRRLIEARGERLPGEPVIVYTAGQIEVACTAADEYEVRLDNVLVFRAQHTGARAHVFTPGGWVEEVVMIAWGHGTGETGRSDEGAAGE